MTREASQFPLVMHCLFSALMISGCGGSDTNTSDATGDGSANHKRLFVTSTTYRGDLASASGTAIDAQNAGIAGANKLCQTAAVAGTLGGTWRAIVDQPNGGLDAIADVGPWYRLDGMVVFSNRAQLKTTPSAPLNVDELGNSQNASSSKCVWTGLMAGGTPIGGCELSGYTIWTSGNSGTNGISGSLTAMDSTWINDSGTPCNSPCHLYCVEQ